MNDDSEVEDWVVVRGQLLFSFGVVFVAGSTRVPIPATGTTNFLIFIMMLSHSLSRDLVWNFVNGAVTNFYRAVDSDGIKLANIFCQNRAMYINPAQRIFA